MHGATSKVDTGSLPEPAHAIELELKLDIAPTDAYLLASSGILLPAPDDVAHLRAVYFDTPSFALESAGFSLRIRSSDAGRTQTVKSGGSSAAGLFSRREWECEAKGDAPDIDDMAPIRALLNKRGESLSPVFEICFQRSLWTIEQNAAQLEVVIDSGEIIAGDRRSPFCELEIECKHGSSADIFDLACMLDEHVPVRIGVISKAGRGYRLIGPLHRGAYKAAPVQLDETMTATEAFQSIVRECVRQFRMNEPQVISARDPDALHQARVALRRLRSALLLFRPMLRDKRSKGIARDLRWLVGQLGPARDIDVLLAHAGDSAAAAKLSEAREAAYDSVVATLDGRRARLLMLALSEWAAAGDWIDLPRNRNMIGARVRRFAAMAIERRVAKLRKQAHDVTGRDDHARHEVRKAAKKLRYGVEFFAELYRTGSARKDYAQFSGALESLQDDLGLFNDVAMIPPLFDSIGIDPGEAAMLLPEIDRGKLIGKARKHYRKAMRTRPFWKD
jgi:triphosphatase